MQTQGNKPQKHKLDQASMHSNNARLNDMAIARANMRKEHALKLSVVQHKYAAQVAVHARALERHARKLKRLHAKINAEAIATAGADFADHHTLGFDEYESISAQQMDNEGGSSVEGAGIVDVIDMANSMANRADRVAACQVPPALVSE
jgi:hypothetical protein